MSEMICDFCNEAIEDERDAWVDEVGYFHDFCHVEYWEQQGARYMPSVVIAKTYNEFDAYGNTYKNIEYVESLV